MADQNADRLDAGLLPVLVKAFPKAFFPDGLSCRPLRVGIFGDLDAVLPREIDRAGLKLYLGTYTRQPRYLRTLTPGAIRIDLNGKEAGKVTAKQAASAAARLQIRHGIRAGQHLPATAPCPASATPIPPARPITVAHAGAGAPRPPSPADLAGALHKKKHAQAGQLKGIVVRKRRKASPGNVDQRF